MRKNWSSDGEKEKICNGTRGILVSGTVAIALASGTTASASTLCNDNVYIVGYTVRQESGHDVGRDAATGVRVIVNKSRSATSTSPGSESAYLYLRRDDPTESQDLAARAAISTIQVANINRLKISLADSRGRCIYASGRTYFDVVNVLE